MAMQLVKIDDLPALIKERKNISSLAKLALNLGLHSTYFSTYLRKIRRGEKIVPDTVEKIWMKGTGWCLNKTDIDNQDKYIRLERICLEPIVDLSDVLLDVGDSFLYKMEKSSKTPTENVPIPDWNIQEYKGFHVGDYVLSTARDVRGAVMRIVKIDNDPVLPFKCEVPTLEGVFYKSPETIVKIN